MPRKITIIYAHDVGGGADAFDVERVAAQIQDALERQGWQVALHDIQPDASLMPNLPRGSIVFNLVERIQGSDALAAQAIAQLEEMGLVLTGARATHFADTADKILAKKHMQHYGIPVLPSFTLEDVRESNWQGPMIVKSITEHASVGMDEKAVVQTPEEAYARLQESTKKWGGRWFAEPYIDGREFNISLLQKGSDVDVLPIAEMQFVDYPAHLPKIIDFAAKWDETAFGYHHTVRSFKPQQGDEALWDKLKKVATACWHSFGLCGYARVDIRVDAQGRPWVLEINVDPCLEQSAGFMAAAAEADMNFEQTIARIIDEAVRHATLNNLKWRTTIQPTDIEAIRKLTAVTGYFNDEEVRVAAELVEETLSGKEDYRFLIAEHQGYVMGYSCFGEIPLTEKRYDLYWLAVDPALQGIGLGRALIHRSLWQVRALGGDRIYAETSGTQKYSSTRQFYDKTGFTQVANLPDFYRMGDDKVIYCKYVTA